MNLNFNKKILSQMVVVVLPMICQMLPVQPTSSTRVFHHSRNSNENVTLKQSEQKNLSKEDLLVSRIVSTFHISFINKTKESFSNEKVLNSSVNRDTNTSLDFSQRQKRSQSICPKILIYGQCPVLTDYPNCNMYHITSVCPWRIENSVVTCLTRWPCFGIHEQFQNLQCKPIYWGYNHTRDIAVACIAVKPLTKMAAHTDVASVQSQQHKNNHTQEDINETASLLG